MVHNKFSPCTQVRGSAPVCIPAECPACPACPACPDEPSIPGMVAAIDSDSDRRGRPPIAAYIHAIASIISA